MLSMNFDRIAFYKNFKMGTEIDISGTFIFSGMKELEKIKYYAVASEVFSFLYHIAVGIERLQKVLLVLLEEIEEDKINEFEESLKTHNHVELHNRINNKSSIKISSREINFLNVLRDFYKNCRYDRFTIDGNYDMEIVSINKYIESNIIGDDLERHFISGEIENNSKVKELFGRVIGSLSRKYYTEIQVQSRKQNLYTYELRYDSPAGKIFSSEFRKDSLREQSIIEQIALKELLLYLTNTKESNSFLRFFREIEPIDLDPAMLNEYIEELCKGIISQDLIDTVESLYTDLSDSQSRIETISVIGNKQVDFEFPSIGKCVSLLKTLLAGELSCFNFAQEFYIEYSNIDDDEIHEELKQIFILCARLLNKENGYLFEKTKFLFEAAKAYEQISYLDGFGDNAATE